MRDLVACVAFAAVVWPIVVPTLRAADDLPADILLVHNLRYREGTNRHWFLDLAAPKAAPDALRPAIVVIHGGGWIEGDKSSFSTPRHPVPGNIIDFARRGYVAVTINYRMSGEAQFPAALDDCRTAIRWLRANAREYHIDPDRIGAYGNSAGGHLALMLALAGKGVPLEEDAPWPEYPSRVQSAVSDSGPVDMAFQYEQGALRVVVSKFMGGPPDGARAAEYKRASPSSYVAKETPPLLLIYGVADNQVPVETADRFVLALEQAGQKDVSYHRLAAVDHCPYSLIRVPWLKPVVDEFFDRTLRRPEAPRKE